MGTWRWRCHARRRYPSLSGAIPIADHEDPTFPAVRTRPLQFISQQYRDDGVGIGQVIEKEVRIVI